MNPIKTQEQFEKMLKDVLDELGDLKSRYFSYWCGLIGSIAKGYLKIRELLTNRYLLMLG